MKPKDATPSEKKLDKLLKQCSLTHIRGELLERSMPCIFAQTRTREKYSARGNSRIGGLPDLPPELPWPTIEKKPLSFLCQIRLFDLRGLTHDLPRAGMLYFFLGDNGSANDVEVVVLHFSGKASSLRKTDVALPELSEEDEEIFADLSAAELEEEFADQLFRSSDEDYRHYPHHLSFEPGLTFPCGNEIGISGLTTDEDINRYHEMNLNWCSARKEKHQLLGHVQFAINDPRAEAARARGGKPQDWRLLLSLESDRKARFNFWDHGTLQILIRARDLAKCRFDRVHGVIATM